MVSRFLGQMSCSSRGRKESLLSHKKQFFCLLVLYFLLFCFVLPSSDGGRDGWKGREIFGINAWLPGDLGPEEEKKTSSCPT